MIPSSAVRQGAIKTFEIVFYGFLLEQAAALERIMG